jgi:hypothetical protein
LHDVCISRGRRTLLTSEARADRTEKKCIALRFRGGLRDVLRLQRQCAALLGEKMRGGRDLARKQ